jgi:hypothetical protein
MNTNRTRFLALLAIVAAASFASQAQADPLPGRDRLKFSQLPMDGTPITSPNGTVSKFYGHDELSTAYSFTVGGGTTPYRGAFMADDFADKFSTPVVHVKWWGSYLDNVINTTMPINKFLISFESDVPQGPGATFSTPGQPLLSQIVKRGPLAPSSGTFTETQISPGGLPRNEHLYEYNAELNLGQAFFEKPDTVYWLKIVALADAPTGVLFNPFTPPASVTRWGWHNRDYTIQDSLASTSPAVNPGEFIEGVLGPAPGGTNVWHFQDDAVTGQVTVVPSSSASASPIVFQTNYQPTFYVGGGVDGPNPVGQMSKDLAFQLFTTVPEPATCALSAAAVMALVVTSRRRSGKST